MGAGVVRAVIPGAAGKMGRALLQAIADTPGIELAAAIERPGHPDLGGDSGLAAGAARNGVPLTADSESALAGATAVIDFTTPASSAFIAGRAAARRVPLVVGTTGLDPAQRRAIEEAATAIPVLMAPNMALGVNLLFRLAELAAAALGDAYDVEIVEAHHRAKRDAPSGTALRLGQRIAAALGRPFDEVARTQRHGEIGARPPREIGIQTVRGGDVVGEHTAFFLGQGERIEITHRATSRHTFARGALRAALWLQGVGPGLYDMDHVLGLR